MKQISLAFFMFETLNTLYQSLYYYGGEITNAMRLDALERESEAKGVSAFRERGKIGF